MKSQRRHQLQQNALADALGTGLDRATPWLKPAVAALIVVLLGLGIYLFVKSRSQSYRSSAAGELLLATGDEDPRTYEAIASEYPDTTAGRWALLAEGDLYLAQGIDALYVDRSEAEELLKDAVQSYRAALADASEPMLVSHAHFGLAQALEASGELEEAAEHFEAVAQTTDSKVLKETAQQRAEHLRSSEAKEFYSWLASAAGTSGAVFPQGQTPGAGPAGSGLPDMPNFSLPDLTGLQAPENAAPSDQPDADDDAPGTPSAEPAGDEVPVESDEAAPGEAATGDVPPVVQEQPVVETQTPAEEEDATDAAGAGESESGATAAEENQPQDTPADDGSSENTTGE